MTHEVWRGATTASLKLMDMEPSPTPLHISVANCCVGTNTDAMTLPGAIENPRRLLGDAFVELTKAVMIASSKLALELVLDTTTL